MGAVNIDLRRVSLREAGVHGWALKADAKKALDRLRERGRNATGKEEIHRADNRFMRFWVIGRPDPLAEFTWLMGQDGTWARGRLVDRYDQPPVWVSMPTPERIPPTFTHITRTVPHHARAERYRTKSNGSCGRYVRDDDAVALCTCVWTYHAGTRAEARAAARAHRDNPGDYPPR